MSKFLWVKRCARLLNNHLDMDVPLAVGMANALWTAYSPSSPLWVVNQLLEEVKRSDAWSAS
jgi:hypothetical protein